MSIIYVVTDGSYSDYGIKGMYTTKEKAELAKKLFAADNDIEEWELDALPKHREGLFRYDVYAKENGDLSLVDHRSVKDDWDKDDNLEDKKPSWTWRNEEIKIPVWARDEKHAVKIAADKWREMVALNSWPEKYKY